MGKTPFRYSVKFSFGVVGLNFSSSLIVGAYRHEESNNVTKDHGWKAQYMVWLDTVFPAIDQKCCIFDSALFMALYVRLMLRLNCFPKLSILTMDSAGPTVVDTVAAISQLMDLFNNRPNEPPSLYIDVEGINLSRHGSILII